MKQFVLFGTTLFIAVALSVSSTVRHEFPPRMRSTNAAEVPLNAAVLYKEINIPGLPFACVQIAVDGYKKLRSEQKLHRPEYLTIIDMSRSANLERLFIIDVKKKQVVHRSLVAHGEATGEEYACDFSNIESSHQSSLGFYVTAETYEGDHGLSIRLDGMEPSNDKARERDIVIHNAPYVSYEYINWNGRLGRSWGCPALPYAGYMEVVDMIKDGTCLFIYAPDKEYLATSPFANAALNQLAERE